MMPNVDPRTLKNMMAKMGIKSSEIEAVRVVIECNDKDIVIDSPQIMQIEAQGSVSFQISGNIQEKPKSVKMEVTDEDIQMVMEKTGVTDREKVKKALEDANGDIAQAIVSLTG